MLGFDAAQEAQYRVVLRHSGSTVGELAALVGLTPAAFREQVALFAGAGLVDVHDDVVLALPPAQSIARLVSDEGRRLRQPGRAAGGGPRVGADLERRAPDRRRAEG